MAKKFLSLEEAFGKSKFLTGNIVDKFDYWIERNEDKLTTYIITFGGDNKKIHVAVAHSNNLEIAQHFLEEVKKAIPDAKDYYLDSLSLSVSTHIGPGSLAIALSKEI